jgi:hypothetical protein
MNKTGAEQSEVGCDDSNGNDDKEQERLSPSPHLTPSQCCFGALAGRFLQAHHRTNPPPLLSLDIRPMC